MINFKREIEPFFESDTPECPITKYRLVTIDPFSNQYVSYEEIKLPDYYIEDIINMDSDFNIIISTEK